VWIVPETFREKRTNRVSRTEKKMTFEAPLPQDFREALKLLRS